MQEEVENRTLTLTVNATKFTGRVLKAALSKYLAHRKNKKLQNSRDSPDGVKPYYILLFIGCAGNDVICVLPSFYNSKN